MAAMQSGQTGGHAQYIEAVNQLGNIRKDGVALHYPRAGGSIAEMEEEIIKQAEQSAGQCQSKDYSLLGRPLGGAETCSNESALLLTRAGDGVRMTVRSGIEPGQMEQRQKLGRHFIILFSGCTLLCWVRLR